MCCSRKNSASPTAYAPWGTDGFIPPLCLIEHALLHICTGLCLCEDQFHGLPVCLWALPGNQVNVTEFIKLMRLLLSEWIISVRNYLCPAEATPRPLAFLWAHLSSGLSTCYLNQVSPNRTGFFSKNKSENGWRPTEKFQTPTEGRSFLFRKSTKVQHFYRFDCDWPIFLTHLTNNREHLRHTWDHVSTLWSFSRSMQQQTFERPTSDWLQTFWAWWIVCVV